MTVEKCVCMCYVCARACVFRERERERERESMHARVCIQCSETTTIATTATTTKTHLKTYLPMDPAVKMSVSIVLILQAKCEIVR